MKAQNVQLGKVYAVKVSGRVVPVRLVRESPYGGWNGRSEVTGREVRIRTAAKLRYGMEHVGGRWVPTGTCRPQGPAHSLT